MPCCPSCQNCVSLFFCLFVFLTAEANIDNGELRLELRAKDQVWKISMSIAVFSSNLSPPLFKTYNMQPRCLWPYWSPLWALVINTEPLSGANIYSIALSNMLNNLKHTEDSLMLSGGGKIIPIWKGQGVGVVFAFLFLLNAFWLYSWKGHSYRTLKAK